jgi:hypothetical protein
VLSFGAIKHGRQHDTMGAAALASEQCALTYNYRAVVGLLRVQADLLEGCATRVIAMLLQMPAKRMPTSQVMI